MSWTEKRERRRVQLESHLGTSIGQEQLIAAYRASCRPAGSNGVMSANPATDARLRDMIEAILEAEFPTSLSESEDLD